MRQCLNAPLVRFSASSSSSTPPGTATVVLDGANIARRGDRRKDICNLQAAIAYFQRQQCVDKCVVFLPKYFLRDLPADAKRKLLRLEAQGHAVLTPSHTACDVFMLDFALRHDAFVVTNGKFERHVNKKVSLNSLFVPPFLTGILIFCVFCAEKVQRQEVYKQLATRPLYPIRVWPRCQVLAGHARHGARRHVRATTATAKNTKAPRQPRVREARMLI